MRQFLIDELSRQDAARLDAHLKEHAESSAVNGLYWVEISRDLLDPGQYETRNDHPFCFAIEVGETWAKFEFLIRSRANMRSPHTRYANPAQQKFIMDFSARLIRDLDLKT
ncbi:MAG: hypothetical protein KKB20_10010 [Proteobacteria bacterium]|nr:hypothetical protein [Pseudomonadota bacterium]